ncbi:MAG: competence/damage-inducible protein A [Dysgonamonadaceae bacterium]|nr:competence/damage-inducible protein A [Dysgonamonadaceae bacterium]
MEVEIITIGDELLIGQVIDTNSAWMAKQLNIAGFDVRYKTTIGDNESDILSAFEKAFSRVTVVLVTGGIGPTKDDITKQTLCKFFNTRLIFDALTLENVDKMLCGMHKKLNDLTRQQAYVPENCKVIQNKAGTAPVTWFEKSGKILVSMPGVPYEMKWAMANEIIPRLRSAFPTGNAIQHRTFWVKNHSESALALHLQKFEDELPANIRLAYLPSSGFIRLRLTGKDNDEEKLKQEMFVWQTKLSALLNSDLFSEEDADLEAIMDKVLKDKKLTLSLAESCTGGKLASLFTAIPGCSQYFKGGIVAYSNEAKQHYLGVNPSYIDDYGAVSQQVVEEMAKGVAQGYNTDCAIATSGVAGPDGGTPEKPVGTVWIAVFYKGWVKSEMFHFTNNRESNILRSCNNSIQMLLEMILSKEELIVNEKY